MKRGLVVYWSLVSRSSGWRSCTAYVVAHFVRSGFAASLAAILKAAAKAAATAVLAAAAAEKG